jgi:hypothetical protein
MRGTSCSQNTLMVNHFIDQNGFLWVGDGPTSRILKFDLNGNHLYSWGAPGPQAGRLACSHGITTDQMGNLYLADCFAGRVAEVRAGSWRRSNEDRGTDPADLGHMEAQLSRRHNPLL